MKILAIETATDVCGVAISDSEQILTDLSLETPHIHSEQLIPLIEESFQLIQNDIHSVDGIAVSIGPGSFTGLRIGLSVAKGLAYSTDKPIIGIPTLEGLAFNAGRGNLPRQADIIVPMIDARREEIYMAVYRNTSGNLVEVVQSCAVTFSECLRLTKEYKKILVLGDGSEKFQKHLQKVESEQSSRYIIPPPGERKCSASAIALLGARKLTGGEYGDLATLEPLYVKEFYTLVKTQHHKVTT